MKQTPSLDTYLLFIAVADANGLAGAARITGVSVPTLSRKMTELENHISSRLFERGARGYALTACGRSLLHELDSLREVSTRLSAYINKDEQVQVRITAGQWTSKFLAQNIKRYWSPEMNWVPVFHASNARVDIARREADIGVRNQRPDQSWLAGRVTNTMNYAIYAKSAKISGFIGLDATIERTSPSDRWLRQNHSDDIITTVNNIALSVDLALAGVGRILLPTFAARAFPDLQRIGPAIEELHHEEWLVCHHDARHDPPVRAALDGIHSVLADQSIRDMT